MDSRKWAYPIIVLVYSICIFLLHALTKIDKTIWKPRLRLGMWLRN